MICSEAQTSLSLYLYGELDFAREEELELHLDGCAYCQRALEREKAWHTSLNASRPDVPLDLLSQCRRQLRSAISETKGSAKSNRSWWTTFHFSGTRWSGQIALASFLVMVGFSAGRLIKPGVLGTNGSIRAAGVIDPNTAHVRDIQVGENDRLRIVVDQVNEREITGRPEDDYVRRWLLAAMKDPSDPGIRVDSVEILKGQDGADVRDALINGVRNDNNAAVRLRALEGLRRFANDPPARDALKYVLQHDQDATVRSEAIDILAPANGRVQLSPDLAVTLEQILRSEREDDYLRMRSIQILRSMNGPVDIY